MTDKTIHAKLDELAADVAFIKGRLEGVLLIPKWTIGAVGVIVAVVAIIMT